MEAFMKPFLVISSGLAIFFMVLFISKSCDPPSTPPDDNVMWRQKLNQRESVIKMKDSIIASLQSLRTKEKVRHTSDSLKAERKTRELFKHYSEAKQEVQQVQDSTGRISAYVSVTDSLLQAKDSLYLQEVNHRLALEKLHNSEIAAMAARHVQVVELNQEYVARVASLENKNARLEKRLRNPVSFGINAGPGVVYTPDGKFHGGIGANIGVSFKIRLR